MKKNKGVLVIGATSEIGTAISRELSRLGLAVGIHTFKNKKKAKLLEKEFESQSDSIVLQSNLNTSKEICKIINKFVKWCGNPFGLVYAGGQVPNESWKILTKSNWQKIFQQHCIVPFELIRYLSPELSKGSRIVYLSSISPKYGGSEKTLHYACAKRAGETAILGIANRLQSKGILFNTIRAGFVATKTQLNNRTLKIRKKRIAQTYLRRPGSPEEIAFVVACLYQPKASYIANTIITVAGGD